jgi:hypothetical protein
VRSWILALVAAAIAALVVPDPTLRSILPLVVGSAVAILQFAAVLATKLRSASPVAK